MIQKPSFDYEKPYWDKNLAVFGIDEVGRGCFAGPMVVAAVSFNQILNKKWIAEINDSKLLTYKQRKRLSKLIVNHAKYFIEEIDIETINQQGIEKCNKLAFKNLINKVQLEQKSVHYLIDGRKKELGEENIEFIVKGDQKSISIAAASIVAKVYRDDLMRKLGRRFPGYNFAKNKGYGTKFHQEAIKKNGLCSIHRTSFDLKRFL
jgi:ribonuclease HII